MTTILITGAGRGLGLHLLKAFASSKPHSTVIAAVRDPSAASKELDSLSTSLPNGSRILIVKIDAMSGTDVAEAAKELQAQGVDRIDIVIANSAVSDSNQSIQEIDVDSALRHFQVNTLGPLLLFQGLQHLLAPAARFIVISSFAGSIQANTVPVPNTTYAISKAAVNMLGSRLHVETDLTVMLIHPGWLDTEMGRSVLPSMGLTEIPEAYSVPVDVAVSGIVKIVEGATRETTGGKFLDYKGDVLPW